MAALALAEALSGPPIRSSIGRPVNCWAIDKSSFSIYCFPAFHPAAGKPAASALPAGHWLRLQWDGSEESAKCAMTLGTFKSFPFQEQGQIEINNIPTARTWDCIRHMLVFLRFVSSDSVSVFRRGTEARIAVGRSDVDGKIDMGLGYGQGVDGKQVDKGHLEGHGFALCSSHLNTHGDHLRFVDPVLVFEQFFSRKVVCPDSIIMLALERATSGALIMLSMFCSLFRCSVFAINLETNGNVDEEKQPTGKPIQMLNSNTPDYQKTRYHD